MKKNVTKALAVVAAVAMVSMTSVSAFAADETNNAATTNVTYSVTQSYTWSVPSEINFADGTVSGLTSTVTTSGSGNTQDVKVTKNVIPNGKKLRISLNTSDFKISTTDGASLSYTVAVKGSNESSTKLGNNGTVLDVNAGTNEGSATLVFTLTKDTTEKAGSYSGTLSYKSELAELGTAAVTGTTE